MTTFVGSGLYCRSAQVQRARYSRCAGEGVFCDEGETFEGRPVRAIPTSEMRLLLPVLRDQANGGPTVSGRNYAVKVLAVMERELMVRGFVIINGMPEVRNG